MQFLSLSTENKFAPAKFIVFLKAAIFIIEIPINYNTKYVG